ncbi:MAG: hypothetical protein IPL79_09475 [Myxococcales bacterium]|nr:hypothetical protein [Myxococcales bacterium]
MSAGAHKQEDKLNNVTIVAVGICGAVLVYVSIVALQAFHAHDTASADKQALYGGQRAFYDTVRAQQEAPLASYNRKPGAAGAPDVFQIPVTEAMKLVATEAAVDASNLVPSVGRSDVATVQTVYGRPQPLTAAALVAAPAAAPAVAPSLTPAPEVATPAPAKPAVVKPAVVKPAAVKPAPAPAPAPGGDAPTP